MQRTRFVAIATLSAALATPMTTLAQAPPKPTTAVAPKTEQLDAKACANSGAQATIGQGSDVAMNRPNDGTLSNKLASSDGVICPPQHIDPKIKQPTPPGGTMPVIPPPGSPGGDQSVRPK